MSQKIRVLIADTFDPWFNLATEDWIFRDMDPEVKVLFLWRNSDTVVIGRFQNPFTECNTAKMDADNVKLARRQSGGGAVFHDLGNTNFTFMSGKSSYDKTENNEIIIRALAHFGVKAYASGRNDICVEKEDGPRKISGSAFKETKDRAFHHGTLLIDANLSRLANYLNPDKKKLVSKGVQSVRSRVANLTEFKSDITNDALCDQIIKEFFKFYESECDVEYLDYDYLKTVPALNEYYEKLKDWKWRFGETPKFTHTLDERFEWGGMEVHIDSHKGMIKDVRIFSDSLHPEMIELLSTNLVGKEYNAQGISMACHETVLELPMIEEYVKDFSNWIGNKIS
ncbi:MAG: lipoate--protein ligase [Bacteriovorax sp. MedPE-SWde]|nr:MAG: lipoate--protein ligase [Bacteriovorax sp. MedPE-SWde]